MDASIAWQKLAYQLPELLIAASGSGRSPTRSTPNSDQPTEAEAPHPTVGTWEQLLSLCHLVVRQRALQDSFALELSRQKREAIYHFAYGLSHELNNPLANIATRAGVLAQAESHPQRRQLLDAIVHNAMRGCEMLGDLMLVARPPQLQRAVTAVAPWLGSVAQKAAAWAAPLDVQITCDVQTDCSIDVDPVALGEALWALIRNAIEAMPDGGTVSLQAQFVESARTVNSLDSQVIVPQRVCIEVADQGTGLSAISLEHAFDPYYSGREAGRGLGLGLSRTQRIVDLHGGILTIANRPGGGCSAKILLPIS